MGIFVSVYSFQKNVQCSTPKEHLQQSNARETIFDELSFEEINFLNASGNDYRRKRSRHRHLAQLDQQIYVRSSNRPSD